MWEYSLGLIHHSCDVFHCWKCRLPSVIKRSLIRTESILVKGIQDEYFSLKIIFSIFEDQRGFKFWTIWLRDTNHYISLMSIVVHKPYTYSSHLLSLLLLDLWDLPPDGSIKRMIIDKGKLCLCDFWFTGPSPTTDLIKIPWNLLYLLWNILK